MFTYAYSDAHARTRRTRMGSPNEKTPYSIRPLLQESPIKIGLVHNTPKTSLGSLLHCDRVAIGNIPFLTDIPAIPIPHPSYSIRATDYVRGCHGM